MSQLSSEQQKKKKWMFDLILNPNQTVGMPDGGDKLQLGRSIRVA
jgi:hypothetical protein